MALFSKRRAPEDQPKTSIWRESIELSTCFGFLCADAGQGGADADAVRSWREFDVCHVGLRCAQRCPGLPGPGQATASEPRQWFVLLSTGTVVTMFGLLTWLLAVWASKRVLGRQEGFSGCLLTARRAVWPVRLGGAGRGVRHRNRFRRPLCGAPASVA